MKIRVIMLWILSAAAVATVTGCGAAPDDAAVPLASDTGNVTPQDLQAGIDEMDTRVIATIDAYSKVNPTPDFRYFMHPTLDKNAAIEFDTSDLAAATLSPRIAPLSPECLADSMAGVVEMSYSVDDAAPVKVQIDRNYDKIIPLDLQQTKTLKIEVSKGNEVITCDWFGLGILDVQPY